MALFTFGNPTYGAQALKEDDGRVYLTMWIGGDMAVAYANDRKKAEDAARTFLNPPDHPDGTQRNPDAESRRVALTMLDSE